MNMTEANGALLAAGDVSVIIIIIIIMIIMIIIIKSPFHHARLNCCRRPVGYSTLANMLKIILLFHTVTFFKLIIVIACLSKC